MTCAGRHEENGYAEPGDENHKGGACVPDGVSEHGGRKRADSELHRGCLSKREKTLVPWLSNTGGVLGEMEHGTYK